jgi:TetR/AcrR family transcriptional regulator
MASSEIDNDRLGKPDQDGNAVRDRLLGVALQLFARKGFESASVRELAKAAEVTRPTLHYHFGSKEGLYLELVERLCATVEDSILHSMVPQGTARVRLRSFVLNILDSIIEDASKQRFFFTIVLDPRRNTLCSFHERMRNFIAAIMGLLLEEGIEKGEFGTDDVKCITNMILALVDSFIYNQIFLAYPKSNRDEAEKMLDVLLNQIAS